MEEIMEYGCLIGTIFNIILAVIFLRFLVFMLFNPIGWAIILIWVLFSFFGGSRYKRKRDEEYYRNWEEAYRQYQNNWQNGYSSREETNYQVEKSMKILGIETLSKSAVKSAFRRLSKKYHPDVCKEDHDVCEKVYKDITAAYEYLMEYMNNNNIN
jgi:hypothetical protein